MKIACGCKINAVWHTQDEMSLELEEHCPLHRYAPNMKALLVTLVKSIERGHPDLSWFKDMAQLLVKQAEGK